MLCGVCERFAQSLKNHKEWLKCFVVLIIDFKNNFERKKTSLTTQVYCAVFLRTQTE